MRFQRILAFVLIYSIFASAQNQQPIQIKDNNLNGPVSVKPPIGTATVPPTYPSAGATNADPSITDILSPNTGLPAIIQKIGAAGTGSQASLATANFGNSLTAGNALIVIVGVGNSGTIKVTDTLGNSFTQAVVNANSTTFESGIFYATNIKGGTDAVTVTPSASVSIAVEAYEVSGIVGPGGGGSASANSTINQQGSFDATSGNSGTSTTPTTATVTPVQAYEIGFVAIAIGTANQTPTAFTPWNDDADLVVGGTPSGLFGLHSFSQPLGAQGTGVSFSATITSEPWASAMAVFKTGPILNVNFPATQAVNLTQYGGNSVVSAATGVPEVGIVGHTGASVDGTNAAGPPANVVGVSVMPQAGANWPLSLSAQSSLSTAVVVKASAGNLFGFVATNGAATACFLQFMNTASSPVLGTNAVFSIPLPLATGGSTVGLPGAPFPLNRFTTGISVGLSTTYNGSTACTAGSATIFYM